MVIKNQEVLRWVARQWGSWTEKSVILDVDGMLRLKNGHQLGDYWGSSAQQNTQFCYTFTCTHIG